MPHEGASGSATASPERPGDHPRHPRSAESPLGAGAHRSSPPPRPRRHQLRDRSPHRPLRSRPHAKSSRPAEMSLRVHIDKGVVLLIVEPFDEHIIDQIRALPERRYRRESRDWILPARREQLRAVWSLIGELEETAIDVEISERANRRLARVDVGRVMLRDGVIEIAGPYSKRRMPALRALPERRFDTQRRIWTVRLTRAGAQAILALADGTRPAAYDATSPAGVAFRGRPRGRAGSAPRRPCAPRPGEAITGRALAPPHRRPGLRQPRPRARSRTRHRHLRENPSQSTRSAPLDTSRHHPDSERAAQPRDHSGQANTNLRSSW